MKNTKILAMLACLVMVATAIPSVSAAPTAMSTEEAVDSYVFGVYNYTSDDVDEVFGLSLDETDSLFIWYFNTTGAMTKYEAVVTQDADDVVWFSLLGIASNQNDTLCHAWFNDEDITDMADVPDEATEGLMIHEAFSEDDHVYIVTIPSGMSFEYDDNFYSYDDENIAVVDDQDDEVTNISSFEYNDEVGVYAMNVSDSETIHQIVIVTDSILGADAKTVTGKYIDSANMKPWYLGGKYLSTKTTYSMTTDSGVGYSVFAGDKLAFTVKKDSGMISKYIGGGTDFKMTTDSLTYDSTPWYKFWSSDEATISEQAADVDGIKVGVIEHIYLSEETGAEDNDEIIRANYGVIVSGGEATSASGFEILTKGTTKTPMAVLDTGTVIY